MRGRIRWPEPKDDPDLSRYRAGVAEIWSETEMVGKLFTRVQWWRLRKGCFGRRRRSERFVEGLEWFIDYSRPDPRDDPDGWDDGVILDEHELAEEVRLLDDNLFVLPNGEVTRLV